MGSECIRVNTRNAGQSSSLSIEPRSQRVLRATRVPPFRGTRGIPADCILRFSAAGSDRGTGRQPIRIWRGQQCAVAYLCLVRYCDMALLRGGGGRCTYGDQRRGRDDRPSCRTRKPWGTGRAGAGRAGAPERLRRELRRSVESTARGVGDVHASGPELHPRGDLSPYADDFLPVLLGPAGTRPAVPGPWAGCTAQFGFSRTGECGGCARGARPHRGRRSRCADVPRRGATVGVGNDCVAPRRHRAHGSVVPKGFRGDVFTILMSEWAVQRRAAANHARHGETAATRPTTQTSDSQA